jgi:hypothetical protein
MTYPKPPGWQHRIRFRGFNPPQKNAIVRSDPTSSGECLFKIQVGLLISYIKKHFVVGGAWLWGGSLVALIGGILVVLFVASFSVRVPHDGLVQDHGFFGRLYYVIQANSSVLASIVAVVGVGFSYFLSLSYRKKDGS